MYGHTSEKTVLTSPLQFSRRTTEGMLRRKSSSFEKPSFFNGMFSPHNDRYSDWTLLIGTPALLDWSTARNIFLIDSLSILVNTLNRKQRGYENLSQCVSTLEISRGVNGLASQRINSKYAVLSQIRNWRFTPRRKIHFVLQSTWRQSAVNVWR